jgi:hypothetical protein
MADEDAERPRLGLGRLDETRDPLQKAVADPRPEPS